MLELRDRGSGVLRTSKEMVEVLTRISEERREIGGKYRRAIGRYLGNRAEGLDRYLDDLGARIQALAEEVGGQEVVRAGVPPSLPVVRIHADPTVGALEGDLGARGKAGAG